MVRMARALLAGCLVAYAKGHPADKGLVRPYGLKASRSTSAFLNLPSTVFALTYAVIYQCLRTPPHLRSMWIKKPRVNITFPWARGTMMRFTKCQETFSIHRVAVFQAFEDENGEYMGERTVQRAPKEMTQEEQTIDEEDFE